MRTDAEGAIVSVAAGPEPNVVRAVLRFDPHLAVFRGHFPGNPLVPAVLQIEAVRAVVAAATGRRFRIVAIPKAKFTGPVRPGEVVEAVVRTSGGAGTLAVAATLQTSGAPTASLSLVLEDDGPALRQGAQVR